MLQENLITIDTGIGQFQTEETLADLQSKYAEGLTELEETAGSKQPVYFSFMGIKEETPFGSFLYRCKEKIDIDLRRVEIAVFTTLHDFNVLSSEEELKVLSDKKKDIDERIAEVKEDMNDPFYKTMQNAKVKYSKAKKSYSQKKAEKEAGKDKKGAK